MPDPTIADLQEQTKAAEQTRLKESLDIVDPGQPKPAPEPEAKPEPKPIELPKGASIEAPVDAKLQERLDRMEAMLQQRFSDEPQVAQPQQQFVAPPGWLWDPNSNQWVQHSMAPPYTSLEKAEDGSEFDPTLVQAFTSRDKYYQDKLTRLEQQLAREQAERQQFVQQIQERESREQHKALDELFDKDSAYHDVIGKGSVEEVQTQPHFLQMRQRIAQEMDAIEGGYRAARMAPPSRPQLYDMARTRVCGPRAKDVVTPERIRDYNGRFISKPTAQNGTPDSMPKGPEKAAASIAALLKEQGRL